MDRRQMSHDKREQGEEADAHRLVQELTANGFVPVQIERSLPFDNLVYELSKDHTIVRISRDRGDWYVEVGAAQKGDYFPIEMWVDFLNGVEPSVNSSSFSAKLAALAAYVGRIEERLEAATIDYTLAIMHARGMQVIELMYPNPEGHSREG